MPSQPLNFSRDPEIRASIVKACGHLVQLKRDLHDIEHRVLIGRDMISQSRELITQIDLTLARRF